MSSTVDQQSPSQSSGSIQRLIDPTELTTLLANRLEQLDISPVNDTTFDQLAQFEQSLRDIVTSDMKHDTMVQLLQEKAMNKCKELAKLDVEHTRVKKEKDIGKIELVKANALRARLEKLCNQLQQENNKLKAPSGDDDVHELRRLNTSLQEQYDLREKHFQVAIKSRELELLIIDTKLNEARQQATEERNGLARIKAQLQHTIASEQELRKQLSVYVDKFRQVEETLNRSNELFTTFRREMDQMTKKTRRLERDNQALKQKSDTTNRNILEMAEEVKKAQTLLAESEKRKHQLEKLCRAMQNDARKKTGEEEEEEEDKVVNGKRHAKKR
jgi:chromosome segregation ATPase